MALIRLRRGTAAAWASADPVLASGEPGFETDTGLLKIGNGVDSWSELDAYSGGGGGGIDAEAVRDTIGTALVGTGVVTVTPNDGGDTITVASTATVNSTDAQLRDRATHTGSQPISSVTSLQATLDAKAASSHTHTATGISDSTATGRSVLTAADAAAARTALGIAPTPIRFSAETPNIGATGSDRAAVARTITEARMRVGTASVGSAMTAEVQHYNGTSWSTVATLTVAAGSTTENVASGLSQAQSVGHLVRLNVTSVGSTTPAQDVVVDVVVT